MSNQATSNSDAPAEAAAQTPRKTKRIFLKQPIMLRVCYALVPLMVAGIYFFGWRTAGLLVVCTAGGLITEWIMTRRQGAPISMACFVTCFLYALSLPPTMPLWMAVVGIVVALLFGKMVFGGFGRNFANPAIVGRVFVYVAFPNEMTGSFVPALRGWPGGFAHWSLATMEKAPEWLAGAARRGADALTSATPMWSRRDFDFQTPIKNLFLGNIGGTFEAQHETRVLAAGSVGEVCALLIILAGAYLIITRTANWRLTAGTLAGAVIANILFRNLGGADAVPPLEFTLSSGALLYAAVFMVTDPISAPKRRPAMWMYGLLIGVLIVFLRWKSQFAGAVAFAILLGNMVGPLLDIGAGAWAGRKKAKPEIHAGGTA